MTLPPVVRVFFAIDIPQDAKDALGKFISTLKKSSKSHAIRWTRPENLHITLQFLAEVNSDDVDRLMTNVKKQLEHKVKPSLIRLGTLQLFPNPYRPRVIVLDVTDQMELSMVSALIGEGIKATGYEIEDRPYRAHLTLGRIKHAQGVNLGFLSEFKSTAFADIAMDEVILFRSEPHPEGSSYSIVDRIVLEMSVEVV